MSHTQKRTARCILLVNIMKAFRIFLFLLLVLPALSGQAPIGLRGNVVRSGDEAPVGNATVQLRKAEAADAVAFTMTTADDGGFQFIEIPEGQYRLTVLRDGYVTNAYGQRYPDGSGELLTIAAGRPLPAIRIALTPDGVISGRVTDALGRPMVDVSVSVGRLSYAGGRRSIAGTQTQTTNDLGQYRLFSLPPGQYYVTAKAPDSLGLAAITYPRAMTATDGIAVDLRTGAVLRGIDIQLGPPTMARKIRATAVDVITGQPVASSMWNFMGTQVNRTSVNPVFELERAAPGRYTLVAIAGEDSGRLSFEVTDKDLDLTVPIGAKFDIPGHVSIEGANGSNSVTNLRINLDADSVLRGPTTSLRATPLPDGSFTLKDALAARFRVTVALPGLPGSYVKSIRLGRDDGLMDWLYIDRPPGDSLEIIVSMKAAVVEGRVVPTEQKQPISGATVVLVPEGDRRSHPEFFRSSASGRDGTFRFESVPPGSYKLFAWEYVARDSWLVPEFLQRDEDQGRPVRIQEGSLESLEVPIILGR